MTDESQSASNTPTPRRAYSKPTLVTIGNRQVTSSGRWNNACMAQYLMLEENRLRWVGIGELAKTAWGQNTISTKDNPVAMCSGCSTISWSRRIPRGQVRGRGHHRSRR
jgi:hypothetical protein